MLPVLFALLLQQSPAPVPVAEPPAQSITTPNWPGSSVPPRAAAVRVVHLPTGGFEAYLGERRVEGSAFYRAVLRPDLAERHERFEHRRLALFIAAGMAVLAGPAAGAVATRVEQLDVPNCTTDPTCLEIAAQARDHNASVKRRNLIIGSVVGLGAGVGLALWGRSVHPPSLTEREAADLAHTYNARQGLPSTSGSLRITPIPGGALMALGADW
jgi:uncharacterized membrane protein